MNEPVNSTSPDEPILPERAAVRWARIVRQQRESGLSVKAFCAQHRLTASSLFAWRRKLKPSPTEFQPASQAAFAAVTIAGRSADVDAAEGFASAAAGFASAAVDAPDSGIEQCLPSGRRLLVRRGFDRRLLLEVLETLDDRLATMSEILWILPKAVKFWP